jgi:oligopeptide transport system substrate-binding protein
VGAEQVLRYNVGTEPETLDPTMATGIPESTIISNCFDGLTRTGFTGKEVYPRAAERWEVSADGLTYTFHLRDAVWADGRPVTAHDFEYAYKRILNPEVGAEYAVMLYYIEGAIAYNTGKMKDASTVGVRALDDRTLEIRLASPTPYFLQILGHSSYMPLPRHIVEKNPEWNLEPETYIGNGPFILTEWRHHDRLVFKRNPLHWDAANVPLDRLVFRTIQASSTELAMFETGDLDVTYQVPTVSIPRLRSSPEFRSRPQIATYYICFNTKRPPFDDPRVRQAFSLAVERRVIAEKVCQGGEPPAYAFVPPNVADADGKRDFRAVGGDLLETQNIEKARRLLAEAGYPGGEGFPRVDYLYNDDERHRKIALVLQNMWKKELGVRVNLRVEEWKVLLTHRRAGEYDLCRHGWVGDYADPMTFLELFITGSGLNDAKWSNPAYDEMIVAARNEVDADRRMEMLHRAEALLMERVPIAPLFFYRILYLEKPDVSGFVRTALGYTYFDRASVAER